ncbi:hypothetical protein NDU88_004529 [Pleurodeles waltl]|uniref:Uncharacterized protein n=1 Tax=Pleurodeles waltl TaxID=8319 RepID=A0AAV7WW28_PLEWA|nr:hypothetical protein NDU88_004529 [Pleurodeles waltl]
MLHWLSTPREGGAPVAYLLAADGSQVTGSEPFASTFAAYYQQLYSADPLIPCADLTQFVSDLLMPCLTNEEQEAMDVDVICDELYTVLAQLHVRKELSPIGFPAEFWPLVRP